MYRCFIGRGFKIRCIHDLSVFLATLPRLAVKASDGRLLTSTEQIQKRYQEYYKDLLKNREVNDEYKKHAAEVDNIFEMNMNNIMKKEN